MRPIALPHASVPSGRGRSTKAPAPWLARLVALLVSIAVGLPAMTGAGMTATGGRRALPQVDYLDDPALFGPALERLKAALPGEPRLHRISIDGGRIAVTVVAPGGGDRLDEWSVRRVRYLGLFERDVVAGPVPALPPPHGLPLAAGLFGFGDVAIDRLEPLVAAAVERAALEDPARVVRIEVGAPARLLGPPGYGPLRLSFTVSSGRETATVHARADGATVAADLSGTLRAARLDLLAGDDWPMAEAQASLQALAGPDAVIRRIVVGRKRVAVQRNDPAAAGVEIGMTWDLSGAMPTPFASLNLGSIGTDHLGFRLEAVDFTRLPDVKRTALAAFGSGEATITDITARRPLSIGGEAASQVHWFVSVSLPGAPPSPFGPFPDLDELGLAAVRADGSLASLRLPKRLRPAFDWATGEGMSRALAEVSATLGPEVAIRSVTVDRDGARIEIADPQASGGRRVLSIDAEGDGLTPASMDTGSPTGSRETFTLADLGPDGMANIAGIVEEAWRRLEIPDERPSRVTLYASAGYRTPAGTPHLEVVVNGRRQGVMTYRYSSGEYTTVED